MTNGRRHAHQTRPVKPVFPQSRRISKRKRTLFVGNSRDAVELAAGYAMELFRQQDSIAVMPPLPRGVSTVSELTGRSLAFYIVEAANCVSSAQRSVSDIRLDASDVSYFDVFRKDGEPNATVFRRIMEQHRVLMAAISRSLSIGQGATPHWRARLDDLDSEERLAARQTMASLDGLGFCDSM
jgi:hypothetical protein